MLIEKDFRFDSAHFLPFVPDGHKCRQLHGHTYMATITIRGEPQQPQGWIMDFADLAEAAQPVLKKLDHRFLNAVPGLENPTVENIAAYLYGELKQVIPNIFQVRLQETPTSRCVYPAPK